MEVATPRTGLVVDTHPAVCMRPAVDMPALAAIPAVVVPYSADRTLAQVLERIHLSTAQRIDPHLIGLSPRGISIVLAARIVARIAAQGSAFVPATSGTTAGGSAAAGVTRIPTSEAESILTGGGIPDRRMIRTSSTAAARRTT